MDIQACPDSRFDVVGLGLLGEECLDRESTSRDLDDGCFASFGAVTKVSLELGDIQCSRHDDDLEVFAAFGDLSVSLYALLAII
jgi:hypothetical protein